MTRQRITIIGTGCIGASIGMALRRSSNAANMEIVGHDRDPLIARKAQQAGALDEVRLNLSRALQDTCMVIVAVPLAEMRAVLADLERLLPPDANLVVTDTAPLKVPVLGWADELLPPGAHFVGGDPFLAPGDPEWGLHRRVSAARPDLLEKAVYAVTARPEDHPSAVQAVVNLARLLGAQPLYMDPLEHDVIRAFSDTLPDVLATALLQATLSDAGWGEIRKAAGHRYATATAAASGDAASRRMMALLGREPLLRGLDSVAERLRALRDAIAQGDAETLERCLQAGADAREHWLLQSHAREWEAEIAYPQLASVFQRALQTMIGEVGTEYLEREVQG